MLFHESTDNAYVNAQLTGLLPNEIIPRKFWYHRTCQRNFQTTNKENNYHRVREICFDEVLKVVERVINQKEFIMLSELSMKYEEL